MVFGFLRSIFATPSEPSGFDKHLIEAAIERVIDGTDPRFRALSHYQRRLWEPVEHAVDFVVRFVNRLPPAIAADREGYMNDPRLRALFASPDHLREALSFGDAMREYLRQHPGPLPEDLYGAIGARRAEKNVLGLELDGELVRREVAQVVVNFSNHRVPIVADTERDTRRELMKRGFDYLIGVALQQLSSARTARTQLERQQQQLLREKAGCLRAARLDLGSLGEADGAEAVDLAAIEQQLAGVEAKLQALRADSATLENRLAGVATTFAEPEKYLQLEQISLSLDSMNTKLRPDASGVVSTPTFNEILLAEDRRVTALFVRIPSAELLPPPDFLAEASRVLDAF